jgi:hypothetical protein
MNNLLRSFALYKLVNLKALFAVIIIAQVFLCDGPPTGA